MFEANGDKCGGWHGRGRRARGGANALAPLHMAGRARAAEQREEEGKFLEAFEEELFLAPRRRLHPSLPPKNFPSIVA